MFHNHKFRDLYTYQRDGTEKKKKEIKGNRGSTPGSIVAVKFPDIQVSCLRLTREGITNVSAISVPLRSYTITTSHTGYKIQGATLWVGVFHV